LLLLARYKKVLAAGYIVTDKNEYRKTHISLGGLLQEISNTMCLCRLTHRSFGIIFRSAWNMEIIMSNHRKNPKIICPRFSGNAVFPDINNRRLSLLPRDVSLK
jgi:hypothetical protein